MTCTVACAAPADAAHPPLARRARRPAPAASGATRPASPGAAMGRSHTMRSGRGADAITRGLMQAARRGWVLSQLNKGIVPIQTMRDFIATARFFASQSLVLKRRPTDHIAI